MFRTLWTSGDMNKTGEEVRFIGVDGQVLIEVGSYLRLPLWKRIRNSIRYIFNRHELPYSTLFTGISTDALEGFLKTQGLAAK